MLDKILSDVFDLQYFHPLEDSGEVVIPYVYVPGESRLVVVVGPNAGGKSFLRRLLHILFRDAGVEFMPISMEMRAGPGHSIARAFVFGDEANFSTGQISGKTVYVGIKNCQARKNPHAIFWDEPDIGLSEGYCRGVGKRIADFALDMPEPTKAAFVVTHSKALVRELLPTKPHYIHVGSENPPATIDVWLEAVEPILDPEDLSKLCLERFRKIVKIVDGDKKNVRS